MYKQHINLTGILLCALLAPVANAAPVYAVIGSLSGCGTGGGGFNQSSANEIEFTRASGDTDCLIEATARSGGGSVGVRTNASVLPAFRSSTDARITATALYDDFEFVLPASYTGGTIDLNVNTLIDAQIGAIVDTLNLGSQTILEARLIVRGNPGGFNAFTRTIDSPRFQVAAGGAESLANSATVLETLSSGFVTIDPTLYFAVSLELFGGSNINAGNTSVLGEGTGSSTVDALNTFSFATSGDVFDLPDGFSVNSVSANIVDNRFVAVVPLPASVVLMISGLGTLLLGARKRSRKTKPRLDPGFL